MKRKSLFLLLLFSCVYFVSFAQAKPKKFNNSTKLELVYKGVEIEQYGTTGAGRSFFVSYPYLIINNSKPVAVDLHADILRNYFVHCPMADLHLDEMNRQISRSRSQFWIGVGAGAVTALSGVFAMANSNNSSVFWTRLGLGAGLMISGAYLGHFHMKKADEHLRLSVDTYNAQCYHPQPVDTSGPVIAKNMAAPQSPSEKKYYKDTVLASLERNDSKNSGMFGLIVNPVIVDAHLLNINIAGGLGIFYTYKSLVGISADYRISYLDDIQGKARNNPPYGTEDSYGIPSNYKNSWQANVLAKISVVSWQAVTSYTPKLGIAKVGHFSATALGNLKAEVTRAITIRGGYQLDQRIVESDNGLQLTTRTPAYQYHYGTDVYSLTPDNISSSSTILRSGIIVGGIGYSSFRDLKVHLNDDNYKGNREEKAQIDLYFDLLYEQSAQWQDMIYYHALYPYSEEDTHMPQRLDISSSPIRRMGARLGYQKLMMRKPNFGIRTGVEIGVRPGIEPNSSEENGYFQLGFGIIFGGRIASK